ncbi:glutamine amidotransferase class-I [Cellulomonas flavigena DSM 20109]|uniref:Glutamine amidotransferase class-I n=1 Tax=Cellulomonas flavigena (strain ATCC 482 / DSM 20109 / BCRC 11376 / JCM 18109 / NBRC 3775 / NCIMB 8073 / NRS 134) TaxID=446466 RepID=D5UEF4_CELFN|nr:type 1 glutamine amidotransferase [Cellulomonas flavigena]ADG74614.1 glutamine amidotransferase class-I [Cellulomonas flavigena DSM 20109]
MSVVRPVLVLTHAPHEGPGAIARALDGVPYGVRTVLDSPEPRLPALADVSGVVVMGGPMDADDVVGHPGLAAERGLLAAAVDADVPVLGVCLGHQLLALALGARLHRRTAHEVGFAPVHLLADDPVLRGLGDVGTAPTVLHWHSDEVDLPDGATLLASTDATQVQAFRAGSALGLQFHPELDVSMLDLWLATPDMVGDLDDDEVATIRADGAKVLPDLAPAAEAVFAAFATQVRARA